jgi:hypothetical protein
MVIENDHEYSSTNNTKINDNYTILISNEFDDNTILWMFGSFEEWRMKTSFNYTVEIVDKNMIFDYNNINNDMYNTIFIELELMEHIMKDGNYYLVNGFCERNKKKNNSSIKINKSGDVWLPMNIFQGTLMHELGHAFGMDHTDHIPFKSVLKSTAQFYGRTMHVECLDAKLYCELWGCVNSCKLEQLP